MGNLFQEIIMNDEIDKVLYNALHAAAKAMGKDLLKMSCYVSNWKYIEKELHNDQTRSKSTNR